MTTPHSTSDSSSIFENGRLKQGVYKIQNLSSETYLDIHKSSQETCCRPARDLEDGRGLVRLYQSSLIHISNDSKWEIKHFGIGYTVRRVSIPIKLPVAVPPIDQRGFQVEPGKPDQFCTPMNGVNGGPPLYVDTYPVAWRVGILDDVKHRGYEYVRWGLDIFQCPRTYSLMLRISFYWGPTNKTWDLHCGERGNGVKVGYRSFSSSESGSTTFPLRCTSTMQTSFLVNPGP
jgi:hypothetical protein